MTSLPQWAHVVPPVAFGELKTVPEDFEVEEVLGFEPSGTGEHVYLFIEKKGMNTQELAQLLARKMMIHPKNISYSGLKDKWALTRQWISIHTSRHIDPVEMETSKFRILQTSRHRSKLKRGTHRMNRFRIVIRGLSSDEGMAEQIQRVRKQGVPNYFGDQRFGHSGGNIQRARDLLAGKIKVSRHQRGLYLSAARAFLFNEILSERVMLGTWATGMAGDAMILDGSNSFFSAEILDEVLHTRLSDFDIHPSAPLWGVGESAAKLEAQALETRILAAYPELTRGLEEQGVRQLRRATRLLPDGLSFSQLETGTIELNFHLSRGAFATTVLRELITISPSAQNITLN